MKCKLINNDIKSNYGIELFKQRGVTNIEDFLRPTDKNIQSPEFLDNMRAGVDLIKKTYQNNERILIVVDSDVDGFTSASIIYLYLKDKYGNSIDIDYVLHEGKQHGLQDFIDELLLEDVRYGLVICPDSSSNDLEYHNQLKDINLPCLVLDHHLTDVRLSSNAVIINNQLSERYKNKALTGAGIVWQFCRYFDMIDDTTYANKYIDLAALGIVADMGSMLEVENQAIVQKGFANVTNFCFRAFCDKQDFSMGGKITPITVAFYIVPLMNAMIRVGAMEEKVRLFESFIDGSKKIPSQKRGAKGELEYQAIESARECANARTKQNKIIEVATGRIEIKIHKYDLLENKILFVRLDEDDDFPAELNGLVAMQLSKKFKKPTIVARLNNSGEIKGSLRGLDNSELTNFKSFLTNSGYFEWAMGHEGAAGCCILDKNLFEFHNWANNQLRDVDFGENVFDVNFIRYASDQDIANIIEDLSKYNNYWGQQNKEPYIYIKNINITNGDIQIMGKTKDTVKFEKFGITYIKFHAKQLIEDLEIYPEMQIKVIGRANLNEWGGKLIPQLFIEAYEIKDGSLSF